MKWRPLDENLASGETLIAVFDQEGPADAFVRQHEPCYVGKDYDGNEVSLCGLGVFLLPGNDNTQKYCVTGYPT